MRASAAKDGEQLKDLALGDLDSEEASRPRADDSRQLGRVKSVSDQRGGGGLKPTGRPGKLAARALWTTGEPGKPPAASARTSAKGTESHTSGHQRRVSDRARGRCSEAAASSKSHRAGQWGTVTLAVRNLAANEGEVRQGKLRPPIS